MDGTSIEALKAAINHFGSQSAYAKAINRPQSCVSEALARGNVPAEWCIPTEKATEGKITRHQLRPDLYPREETIQ